MSKDSDYYQKRLIEAGRRIPVLLIKALQEEIYGKAREWLKSNPVPEEVILAFDMADMLHTYAYYIAAGDLNDRQALELPDDIAAAASLAVKFGGSFLSWDAGASKIPPMTCDEQEQGPLEFYNPN